MNVKEPIGYRNKYLCRLLSIRFFSTSSSPWSVSSGFLPLRNPSPLSKNPPSSLASHYLHSCAPSRQCVILTHHHGRAMLLATCPCSFFMAEKGSPSSQKNKRKISLRVVPNKWKKNNGLLRGLQCSLKIFHFLFLK